MKSNASEHNPVQQRGRCARFLFGTASVLAVRSLSAQAPLGDVPLLQQPDTVSSCELPFGQADAWPLWNLPDVTGDGCDDVLVGVPHSGVVLVIDAAHASIIKTISGNGGGHAVAVLRSAEQALSRTAPVNDTGAASQYSGVVIGDPTFAATSKVRTGRVTCLDTSWRQMWEHTGDAGSGFGASLATVGDVDGDGITDVAIGAPGPLGADESDVKQAGKILICSGRSGRELCTLSDHVPGAGFGMAIQYFPSAKLMGIVRYLQVLDSAPSNFGIFDSEVDGYASDCEKPAREWRYRGEAGWHPTAPWTLCLRSSMSSAPQESLLLPINGDDISPAASGIVSIDGAGKAHGCYCANTLKEAGLVSIGCAWLPDLDADGKQEAAIIAIAERKAAAGGTESTMLVLSGDDFRPVGRWQNIEPSGSLHGIVMLGNGTAARKLLGVIVRNDDGSGRYETRDLAVWK